MSTRLWYVAIGISLMMSSSRLLGQTCNPDLVLFTPTPTLKWDAVVDTNIYAYTLYYRYPGGTLQKVIDLPYWLDADGIRRYRGIDSSLAVQRYFREGTAYTDLQTLEFCIKALNNDFLPSTDCSNIISVCMPQIWQPGTPMGLHHSYDDPNEPVVFVHNEAKGETSGLNKGDEVRKRPLAQDGSHKGTGSKEHDRQRY